MHTTGKLAITATAVGALITARIAASVWPEFKQHATTAGIALLALMALAGIVIPLIARQPGIPGPLTPTVQEPPEGRQQPISASHTGGTQ
jgi:hypothetical protein